MGLKRRPAPSPPGRPFANAAVADVFASYPNSVRADLLAVRELIFQVASDTDGVGEVEETLKWGQPAYLTCATKSGTTIRLGPGTAEGSYALYVHCQTTLIDTVRALYGDAFRYLKNRGVLFQSTDRRPAELAHVVQLALTYHQPTA